VRKEKRHGESFAVGAMKLLSFAIPYSAAAVKVETVALAMCTNSVSGVCERDKVREKKREKPNCVIEVYENEDIILLRVGAGKKKVKK